jgi:hypothetical protein
MPLWCFVLVSGWQLRERETNVAGSPMPASVHQFGIRQLMMLTAVVAVLLGVGRAAVPILAPHVDLQSPDTVIIAFLGAAAVVTTLPLAVAALLPRGALLASLIVLTLIGVATLGETPLLQAVHKVRSGREIFLMLVAINAFSAAWIWLVIAALRLSGYELTGFAPPRKP